MSSSSPLYAAAVYCPLLCDGREELAHLNTICFYPPDIPLNDQMNFIGFCSAMSSIADQFGVAESNKQTIHRQRSTTCIYSPALNVWMVAEVDCHQDATAVHQILSRSSFLLKLLYGEDIMAAMTTSASLEALRGTLQSFFLRLCRFLEDVVLRRASESSTPMRLPQPWVRLAVSEASMGYPVQLLQLEAMSAAHLALVDEAAAAAGVQRHCSRRGTSSVGCGWTTLTSLTSSDGFQASDPPPQPPLYAIFIRHTLQVLVASPEMGYDVLSCLRLYCLMYRVVHTSSFDCHLPFIGLCTGVVHCRHGPLLTFLLQPLQDHCNSNTDTPYSTATLLTCAEEVSRAATAAYERKSTSASVEEMHWLATAHPVAYMSYYKSTPLLDSRTVAAAVWMRWRDGAVAGTPIHEMPPSLLQLLCRHAHSLQRQAGAGERLQLWIPYGVWWACVQLDRLSVTVVAWRQPTSLRRAFKDVSLLPL